MLGYSSCRLLPPGQSATLLCSTVQGLPLFHSITYSSYPLLDTSSLWSALMCIGTVSCPVMMADKSTSTVNTITDCSCCSLTAGCKSAHLLYVCTDFHALIPYSASVQSLTMLTFLNTCEVNSTTTYAYLHAPVCVKVYTTDSALMRKDPHISILTANTVPLGHHSTAKTVLLGHYSTVNTVPLGHHSTANTVPLRHYCTVNTFPLDTIQ